MSLATVGLLQLGQRATQYYQARLLIGGVGLELVESDFSRINENLPDQYQKLSLLLDPLLRKFVRAQHIVIPNITLHQTVDQLQAQSSYGSKLIHPLEASISKLKATRAESILIAGSRYTMESQYVSDYLHRSGFTVAIPDEAWKEKLDELRLATYASQESLSMVEEFQGLMEQAAQSHTVVVACTELSLLLPRLGLLENRNIVDTADCQISQALLQAQIAAAN